MSITQLIQASLIGLGAIAIGAAALRANALMELESRRGRGMGWRTMRAMMIGFLVAYAVVIGLIVTGAEHVLGWLVGSVFLGGAAFVYVVVRLSLDSLQQLESTTHSREAFETTLDTVVDAILTIDERGTILFANRGTTEAFGYETQEMVGNNVAMLMPPPYADEHDGYIHRYIETGEARVIGVGREVEGRRKDGTTFPAELAINEMSVAGERRFVGSLRDISERKEVERMKTEFVSIVSHELRTPLTSIRGSLGLLHGGVGGKLSEKGENLLSIGVRSCDRLVRLINDILDVEKIASGAIAMNRESVSVSQLLATAAQGSRGFAEQHEVQIELSGVGPGMQVDVDEDRTLQVITNLLSNAIKFSPRGGVVRVSGEKVGENVRIEVHDDGPGIPEEFRAHVFDRFAQADASATRKIAGSGLGLNISKAIVEQHGGTIGFETSDTTGTTFFVELAVFEEADVTEAHHGSDLVHEAERPQVLICEDDPDLAEVIAETLKKEGSACSVVHDAAQAKEALGRRKFDVLFLDLFLPGQDGISLIRELRAQDATRDLPIVVVSAVAVEGRERLDGRMFRIVDWINKPFEQDRLRAALTESLLQSSGVRARILHVEDDLDVAAVVRGYLQSDAELVHAPTLKAARNELADASFDLVLVDLELPDGNGLELIAELGAKHPTPGILVFSGGEIPSEVKAQVEGVLKKGTTGGEQLRETARRILKEYKRK